MRYGRTTTTVKFSRLGLRDRGKQLAGWISSGLDFLLGAGSDPGGLGILVYHRVADNYRGVPTPSMNVTPRRFGEQMLALKRAGFRIEPLQRVLALRAAGEPLPDRTVVITFDDGFESVYRHAFPVLRDLDIPATIFVSTAYIDHQEPFPFDDWGRKHRDRVPDEAFRPLSLAQCHELRDSGVIELGAHTHTHQDFRNRPEDLRLDLQQSVEWLRKHLGLENITFAFPFGRKSFGFVSDDLVDAARRTGVLCSLTTEAELVSPDSDPFDWGRFNVYDWDTDTTLRAKLNGWYTWAPRLEEWLAGKMHSRSSRGS